jgi:hypothetical protein
LAQRTKLWYLKNVNLFHGMSDEQMRMVEERTVMQEIRRKEVLYLPGTPGTACTSSSAGWSDLDLTDDGKRSSSP